MCWRLHPDFQSGNIIISLQRKNLQADLQCFAASFLCFDDTVRLVTGMKVFDKLLAPYVLAELKSPNFSVQ